MRSDWRASRSTLPLMLCLLAGSVSCNHSEAREVPAEGSSHSAPPIDSALLAVLTDSIIAISGIPGGEVAVMLDGQIVHTHAFGYADIASRRRVGPSSRFAIGSVSKVFAMTAILRLAQEGRLDLDHSLTDLGIDYPRGDEITPRLLAGHLAGIPHYQDNTLPDPKHTYASVSEALGVFRDAPLLHAPGTEYRYSSHGYTLLSRVIEVASGASFLRYIDSAIARPLGLTATAPLRSPTDPAGLTTLYSLRGRRATANTVFNDNSYGWAAGGLASTPEDLLKLARGYLDGWLSDSIVEVAFTSQVTSGGDTTGVGIGWRIGTDGRGRRFVHHAGLAAGGRAVLLFWPDTRNGVALTVNANWRSSIEGTAAALFTAATHATAFEGTTVPESGYSGTFEGDSVSGTLALVNGVGWVTTPPALGTLLESYDDGVARLGLVQIDSTAFAAVTPWGVYPLKSERAPEGFRASGTVAGKPWTIRVASEPRPRSGQ